MTPRKPQTPRSTKTQPQRGGRAAAPGSTSTAKSENAKGAATTPTKSKGEGEGKAPQPEEDSQEEEVVEDEGSQDQPKEADTESSSSQPSRSPQATADQDPNTQMPGQDQGEVKLSSNRSSPDPTVTPLDNTSKHSSLTTLSRTPSPITDPTSASKATTGNTASPTEQ